MTPKEFLESHAELANSKFKAVENVSIPAGKYQFVVAAQEQDFPLTNNGIPVVENGKPVSIPMVRVFAFAENAPVGRDEQCIPVRVAQASIAGACGLQSAAEWQAAAESFKSFKVEKYLHEPRDPRDPRSRDKFRYRAY